MIFPGSMRGQSRLVVLCSVAQVGISIKPKTPVEWVFPYMEDIDLILIMTVEPGFGGQSFMEDMMPKVQTLREKFPDAEIQVDGGLSMFRGVTWRYVAQLPGVGDCCFAPGTL